MYSFWPRNQFATFSDYEIGPPLFEARVTIVFKRMTTVEKTSDKNMKIPKIADRNVIKILRR